MNERRALYVPKIKLVVSDLDGTLLDAFNRISETNRQAIFDLRKEGIKFTFATGRLDLMTQVYIDKLAIEEPVVSCNGALIRTGLSHKLVHVEYMDALQAEACVHFLSDLGIDYMVYNEEAVYYPKTSRKVQVYRIYNRLARLHGSREANTTLFDLQSDLPGLRSRICKIYMHNENPHVIDQVRDFIAKHTDLIAVSSQTSNLDIAPAGQTKGAAVRWLADYYALRSEEICVFGDHDNDVSMMQEAGLSFAMRNATALARKHADLLAEANDVSGVGRAIRQFILP